MNAKLLKTMRLYLELSQPTMANLVGISLRTYTDMESGRIGIAKVYALAFMQVYAQLDNKLD